MPDSEQRLIADARRGSREARGELFALHWRDAWRTARAVCGDDQRAQDIAQEALVQAVSKLGRFDGRRPFGAWLRRIVVLLIHERSGIRDQPAKEIRAEPSHGESGGTARTAAHHRVQGRHANRAPIAARCVARAGP